MRRPALPPVPLATLLVTVLLGVCSSGTAAGAATPTVAPAVTPAVAPAVDVAGGRYVALGDSYAAGLGITPADGSSDGCGRSASNYPHQLAAALGMDLVDVTCSGAVVADLGTAQRSGVAAQFDALTADTRLVTLTIGGNDLGFGAIAAYCTSLSGPGGPVRGGDGQQATCEQHYDSGGSDTLAASVRDTVAPALAGALAQVRQRAPQAAVVVVDYPAIVPDDAATPPGGCWANPLQEQDALPFTTADLPYLQQTQARLDQALAAAATTAGAGVGSVYTESLTHTACGDDPWVNGVRVDGFSLAASSLHPNLAGATAMAAAAEPVARTLLAGGEASAPPAIAVTAGGGAPGWLWPLVGVAGVLALVVGLGTVRVVRRRR